MSLVQSTTFDLSECTRLLSRYRAMEGVDLAGWYRNFFTALPRNAILDHADYLAAVTDALILSVATDGQLDYESTVGMSAEVCEMIDPLIDQIDHWVDRCSHLPIIESVDFVRVTRSVLMIEHHHQPPRHGDPT